MPQKKCENKNVIFILMQLSEMPGTERAKWMSKIIERTKPIFNWPNLNLLQDKKLNLNFPLLKLSPRTVKRLKNYIKKQFLRTYG